MLRTLPGRKSKVSKVTKSAKTIPLVVFSVGGRRLAAKAEEVGGIWPWTNSMLVPSGTAFVNAVLRRGDEILPVFDLAGKLNVQVEGQFPLCLIAKRYDGPIALCIDEEIPILHMLETEAIRPIFGEDPHVAAVCRIGTEELPLYSLVKLNSASSS